MKVSLISLLLVIVSTFTVGQMEYPAYSQTTANDTGAFPIPEFKPKPPVSESEEEETSEVEPPPEPVADRFAAKIEFEPHPDFEDYFSVSNFAFTVMNGSELCPAGNCEFELEGGEIADEYIPGERILTGKLRIETGDSSKIMDVFAPWATVEEKAGEGGEIIRVIDGTFGLRKDPNNLEADFEYRINGTMIPEGSNYIVALHGER
jgi:hypothetical protein